MPNVTNFLPSTHGFSFSNSWPSQPDLIVKTPFGDVAIGDASNGLCGGMVFAVRDYFEAGIPQPTGQQPSMGDPLYAFIVDRLFASFDLPNGPTKYYDWMTTADHDTWLKTGLAHRTILEEWPQIKADIDSNHLSCLALVTLFSLNPGDMGHNHQVMAYGYEHGADDVLTLRLYDPNSPLDDNIRLSLSLGNPAHTTPISHNVRTDGRPVRGFFRMPYHWVSPPQVDDAEIVTFVAPASMPAGSSSTVTLKVLNRGTTTWSAGGATPYRLGSQRPQDNTTWGTSRVELPHSVAPTQSVDFVFPVKAPGNGGEFPMGWRMVRESMHWFGELEARIIQVASTLPPNPCQQLRNEILAVEADIRDLQEQLQDASPGGKAFLVAQIKKKQAELASLRAQAKAQGCSNIP